MLHRLQVCIDTFVHQAETCAVPSELIVVDWNPPPGAALTEAVRWPGHRHWCDIRLITVPPAVHAKQPLAHLLPILIHRARNVGVRRARGRFILPTSADILCSDELIGEIARQQLDEAALYRIARYDVPVAALDMVNHDERLRFCREHVTVVHERKGSYALPGVPALFTNGAGDFTLLSRDLYFRLRGMCEERHYHSMHWDSVFCYMAYAACGKELVFTDPCRIYHVDHGTASWRSKPRLVERVIRSLPIDERRSKRLIKKLRSRWPPRSQMDDRGVPYLNLKTTSGRAEYDSLIRTILEQRGAFVYNDADWGLGSEALDEQVIS